MKAVSQTAYYCCGVRMQDAASTHPVIGDNYAKKLMSEEGLQYWQEFKEFKMPNASIIARHYIIDCYLKELLVAHPGSIEFSSVRDLIAVLIVLKGRHGLK